MNGARGERYSLPRLIAVAPRPIIAVVKLFKRACSTTLGLANGTERCQEGQDRGRIRTRPSVQAYWRIFLRPSIRYCRRLLPSIHGGTRSILDSSLHHRRAVPNRQPRPDENDPVGTLARTVNVSSPSNRSCLRTCNYTGNARLHDILCCDHICRVTSRADFHHDPRVPIDSGQAKELQVTGHFLSPSFRFLKLQTIFQPTILIVHINTSGQE